MFYPSDLYMWKAGGARLVGSYPRHFVNYWFVIFLNVDQSLPSRPVWWWQPPASLLPQLASLSLLVSSFLMFAWTPAASVQLQMYSGKHIIAVQFRGSKITSTHLPLLCMFYLVQYGNFCPSFLIVFSMDLDWSRLWNGILMRARRGHPLDVKYINYPSKVIFWSLPFREKLI